MHRGIASAHGFITGKEITEKMEKHVQPMFDDNNQSNLKKEMKCFELFHLPNWSARNLICILNYRYLCFKPDRELQLQSHGSQRDPMLPPAYQCDLNIISSDLSYSNHTTAALQISISKTYTPCCVQYQQLCSMFTFVRTPPAQVWHLLLRT